MSAAAAARWALRVMNGLWGWAPYSVPQLYCARAYTHTYTHKRSHSFYFPFDAHAHAHSTHAHTYTARTHAGAIRELRRDAVFMAGERDREKAALDGERLESERRFYSELQRQEADLKSGGQAGMNPHLKKKKK